MEKARPARARLIAENQTLLEGEPTARVPILAEGGEVVQVELEATESVHLFTDTGFSVKGPCTVRISDRDLLLECNGQLLGAGGQEAGFGWISASGGVRASFGVHSDASDVAALIRGIERVTRIFG